MPVRTAYAGAAVPGEVLTAANVNKTPGGWIGYAEVTANQGGIGTTDTDLTGLSVAVTVGTSRRIRISVFSNVSMQTASNRAYLRIQEGATVLTEAREDIVNDNHAPMNASVVLTPTAGAHTYKVTARVLNAGSTLTAEAATTYPSYILVEDLGPAL